MAFSSIFQPTSAFPNGKKIGEGVVHNHTSSTSLGIYMPRETQPVCKLLRACIIIFSMWKIDWSAPSCRLVACGMQLCKETGTRDAMGRFCWRRKCENATRYYRMSKHKVPCDRHLACAKE